VPSGIPRVLAFLHPAIALVTLALLFHVASIGLRSRERGGQALRPKHAQRAPWALAAVLLTLVSGIVATWLWRPDLKIAGGAHFWIGLLVTALVVTGAILSRWLPESARVKRIHPAVGLLALLFAALQVFYGMPLLPF